MPYFDEMLSVDREDWVRLSFFIADVDELFERVLEARWLLFDEDLRGPLDSAYSAMKERTLRPTDVLHAEEHNLPPKGMANFHWEAQPALEKEGLTGPELHAKLVGYVRARRVLRRSGGVKNLKRTWRWMRAILQSLGNAFPPAAAILEIADLIENGAKDVEDLARDGVI